MITVWKHFNTLRWIFLIIVFALLVLLPYLHVYQNFVAAHSYDFLAPSEQRIYDIMEWLTAPFVTDPARELTTLKGTTWSGTLFGLQLSDPLAWVAQVASTRSFYWPMFVTVLIPIGFTVVFGRFFCGWLCPAGLIYSLVDQVAEVLKNFGFPLRRNRRFYPWLKYWVLLAGILLSVLLGWVSLSVIYPPAIVGRELLYWIAMGGTGAGMAFFVATVLFDLLVVRRGFCRFLCPGGALYIVLGHFRWFRVQRKVASCDDCGSCNRVCPYVLDPMRDGFGAECDNCTRCIADCPQSALTFAVSLKDQPDQGPGHAGAIYKKRLSQDEA